MKILQVQCKNRNGHTLRGIVTLPDTEGKVPFVVHLHGFAGSCSGYKSMYTHLSRALAAQGTGRTPGDESGKSSAVCACEKSRPGKSADPPGRLAYPIFSFTCGG